MSFTSKAFLSEAKRSKEYFETSAPTICFSLVWMKMQGFMPSVPSMFRFADIYHSGIPISIGFAAGAATQRAMRRDTHLQLNPAQQEIELYSPPPCGQGNRI